MNTLMKVSDLIELLASKKPINVTFEILGELRFSFDDFKMADLSPTIHLCRILLSSSPILKIYY